MIFNLENGILSSVKTSFSVDLAGNFTTNYPVVFAGLFRQVPSINNEIFLLPLSVQFRPSPDGSIWLDWTESEKRNEDWAARFVLTVLDRSFQAANEICRRTNEFELQIVVSESVEPAWITLFSDRLKSDYHVEVRP